MRLGLRKFFPRIIWYNDVMGLDDLKKKLSREGQDFSGRYERPELRRHVEKQVPRREWRRDDRSDDSSFMWRRIFWWGVGGGLLVIALVSVVVLIFSGGIRIGSNANTLLDLTVEGSEEIVAGDKAVWKVAYHNNNTVALLDTVITFEFPPTAQSLIGDFSTVGLPRQQLSLGTIAPGGKGEEMFSAILFGAEGDTQSGKVFLEYRPEGSSVRLSKEVAFSSLVTSSLLGISVETPEQLKSSQEAEMLVRIVSSAKTPYRGLWADVEYPEAFEYISADPRPVRGDHIWSVGDLPPDGEFIVKIKGKIRETVAVQNARAKVGLYDRTTGNFALFSSTTKSFEIAPAFLAVSFETIQGQLEPGVATAGDSFIVNVRWRNNLPVPVTNATVDVRFEGEAVDLRTIKSERGEFNPAQNALVWVPGRIPELLVVEPEEEGAFGFEFRTKKDLVGKNFTVRLTSSMRAPEVPEGYAGVDINGLATEEFKVASRVAFSQKGFYTDSRIRNSGPLPPRVGEETTYLVVWSVTNTANDITGAVAHATLPSYIRWMNVVIPAGGGITFDPVTRELTWSPGAISPGVGYSTRAKEVAFQIGFTPSVPQVGTMPQLVSEATFEGVDAFTGRKVAITSREFTTSLDDDPAALQKDGNVRE